MPDPAGGRAGVAALGRSSSMNAATPPLARSDPAASGVCPRITATVLRMGLLQDRGRLASSGATGARSSSEGSNPSAVARWRSQAS